MKPDEKRLLDIQRIMPYDSKGTKGWLVRFNYYPDGIRGGMKCHSKLFSWNRFGTPDAALEEARRYRDQWISTHRDVLWLRGGGEYSQILPKNNTSGIVGINRSERLLPSGTVYPEWQASLNQTDGRTQNRKFSVLRYGELGAMARAIEFRRKGLTELLKSERFSHDPTIPGVIAYYADILTNLEDLKDQDTSRSVLEIVRDPQIDATSKYQEICVRVGQQRFRREVLEFFDRRCAVTGSSTLIRASHIKPWRCADDRERVDYLNGLALSPAFDAAFDLGLISFRSDGVILVAPEFESDGALLGIVPSLHLSRIEDGHRSYLDWHRKNVFLPEKRKLANQALQATSIPRS